MFYFDYRKILKYGLFIVVLFFLLVMLMDYLPDSVSKWAKDAGDQMVALFTGDTSSSLVFSEILVNDIILPSNIWFGVGAPPEWLSKSTSGIDNGYVQCVWRYGLVGTILLLFGYVRMFTNCRKTTEYKKKKVLMVVYVIIFFMYMMKLYSITNYGALFLLFGTTTLISCESNSLRKYLYGGNN
jgi:hypothetical protein